MEVGRRTSEISDSRTGYQQAYWGDQIVAAFRDRLAAPFRIEQLREGVTLVHVAPNETVPPHPHREGYVVLPLASGSLDRITYEGEQEIKRESVTLLPWVPYFVEATKPNQTISVLNTGDREIPFQKIVRGPPIDGPQLPLPMERITIAGADGKHHHFRVEMATTLVEQAVGLMFRTRLAEHHGMLFIWSPARQVAMTMRNVLIPLDILFIDADQTVSRIHRNAQPNSPAPILSDGEVIATLEIAGGTADKLGIQEGAKVSEPAAP
jgi:uncharacterized membrane protein (UPF0127 family)